MMWNQAIWFLHPHSKNWIPPRTLPNQLWIYFVGSNKNTILFAENMRSIEIHIDLFSHVSLFFKANTIRRTPYLFKWAYLPKRTWQKFRYKVLFLRSDSDRSNDSQVKLKDEQKELFAKLEIGAKLICIYMSIDFEQQKSDIKNVNSVSTASYGRPLISHKLQSHFSLALNCHRLLACSSSSFYSLLLLLLICSSD